MLNDNQRLHLQEMIKANNTEDTTNAIREVRHSSTIHSEVQELINLRVSLNVDPFGFKKKTEE